MVKKYFKALFRAKKETAFMVTGFVVGFAVAFVFDSFTNRVKYRFLQYVNLVKQEDGNALVDGFADISTDFRLYWQVYSLLKQEYVDPKKIDDKAMYYGSIKGLVSSIGDPATLFFDPKEREEYRKGLSGEYEGIGAVLEPYHTYTRIVGVFEGAPAERAGLKVGDVIVEVDGKSVVGESIVRVVNKIRGPKGSTVELTVLRPSENNKRVTVKITRAKIDAPSMRYEILDGHIGMLRISRFADETFDNWKLELASYMGRVKRELDTKVIDSLIIDLRGNPGGFLAGAIEFLSYFLPSNSVVVFQEGRDGIVRTYRTYEVGEISIPDSVPVVVLVDSASASAAEIVAGVLQHYKRAYLVGTKTFGKGTVQISKEFNDGSMLKYTIAYWLLPNKQRLTHTSPIVPDLEIKFNEQLKVQKGIDNQLESAKDYINSKLR